MDMTYLLQKPPKLSESEVTNSVQEYYGLEGTLHALPGDRDQNFLLEAPGGQKHVVKVSSLDEAHEILEFETEMITRLSNNTNGLIPSVIPAISGTRLVTHENQQGHHYRLRILEFLPGTLLAEINPRSDALLMNLGERMAELGSVLGAYPDHPPPRINFEWALGQAGNIMEKSLSVLGSPQRALIELTLKDFLNNERDFLGLGSQIIHGDVNDHNVIVSLDKEGQPRISGIIDLGDAHSAPRVFDLAIAIAYGIIGTADPLLAASEITRGYYAVQPLLDIEIDVLMTLVCARLGQSVCIASLRRNHGDTDPYHLISEAGAWKTLLLLAEIPRQVSTGTLRQACGLEACSKSVQLRKWLDSQSFEDVLTLPENSNALGILDLSISSPDLTGRDSDDTEDFTNRVSQKMRSNGLTLGIGRFMEPRGFYIADAFEGRLGDPRERRTIHLGIDLFQEPGTAIHAPLAGRVHTVRENQNRLDYGPTVILEHSAPSGLFWTLYGHLERASVENLKAGDSIDAGQLIARIGTYPENGDWPPHLHFQIITDLMGFEGNFPGVALPRDSNVWTSFCPDPNLILNLPSETTYMEPKGLFERRRQVLSPNLSLSYETPIHIVRGKGSYLFDVLGRSYLDCVNNVAHVGHEHPHVVGAGQKQMGVLNTNSRYLHSAIIEYAERLSKLFPEPLSVCLFVNSGSEANELALRIARTYTSGTGIAVLEGGYHGNTPGLIDVSHYKFTGSGGHPPPPWTRTALVPDEFRGRYRRDDPSRATLYAADVGEAFRQLDSEGHHPAAFLSESLLSCAGQIEPPQGYLTAAYEHARAAGALCIADEIQVGFGRLGSHMWGFETQGVVPDIVTLGKPMGNGHPIGAVVTTPEIAETFDNGMEFFSSFGGNPVSAVIALAVLDILEDEKLQANAATVGTALKTGLNTLMRSHSCIGDVRGRGLFLGVEFVESGATLEPAPAITQYVVEHLKKRGVLLSFDGPDHNVIKIKPPMSFSESDAERLISELDQVLAHDFVQGISLIQPQD
ncbi:MAG: aminotransferase class III-fold pyridoxal phosphate-dependent enzyme [Gemmatimonadota bacterium]|nr:aminotransferase class III-fold pyridoxal phosphate-dependent enzyme [Gemmatimonadota bacterium]